ncbi:hypothetical protein GJU39_11820 [Pedobacter petrophilus]|uniref:Uncharacterized protein n=1 Tax=Pedobacter petrophilus TaxID=1908241 RepID=A0A7K0FZ36_9SPHI|nr:hypothetical protein [Pedobacter petrophilus]MRX76775.1 hypothetical protein [Pedobacter petrophilus]
MKRLFRLSIFAAILTSNAFAQQNEPNYTASSLSEVYESIDGNKLIKKMISAKHEFNKKHGSKPVSLSDLPVPQHIFNRNKLTLITFDGLDYLIQNNRVLAIKGLNLPDDALILITEKLTFLDQVQFDYNQKINLVYTNGESKVQNIRNLDKWYLLTLRILSSTVNDIAALIKRHDTSSLTANLIKMPIPNIDVINIPGSTKPIIKLVN